MSRKVRPEMVLLFMVVYGMLLLFALAPRATIDPLPEPCPCRDEVGIRCDNVKAAYDALLRL